MTSRFYTQGWIILLSSLVCCFCPSVLAQNAQPVRIGSKSFTESVVLGEMLSALARHAGAEVQHQSELGGTQILWQALLKGDIDAYIEYSGTISEEILPPGIARDLDTMREQLDQLGVVMGQPLGFNNTYALGMKETRAEALGIRTISQLADHPELTFGFSDEFIERSDGWSGLKQKYKLPHESVRSMDHSLAYRGVWTGSIDVVDLYSTDPEIVSFELRVLEDDKAFFPLYEAVIVYRKELAASHPRVVEEFNKLAAKIDSQTMARLNKASRIERLPEPLIAIKFLNEKVDASIAVPDLQASLWQRRMKKFWSNSVEHLFLVSVSLTMAILTSIPLGILAYKQPKWGGWILGAVGIIQTIPSMALLVFMIPLLGLGAAPAILALFLYSLLPIVRGTHTGLSGIAPSVHESAMALGLPGGARLRLIELPIAMQSILSGIKTSAVINVGTATIGALIGAGGYGQPIITGIRLADFGLILQGAVPAAILALLVQAAFGLIEKFLTKST